jgi:hypothetical protein
VARHHRVYEVVFTDHERVCSLDTAVHSMAHQKRVRSRKRLVACHREDEKAQSARCTSDTQVHERQERKSDTSVLERHTSTATKVASSLRCPVAHLRARLGWWEDHIHILTRVPAASMHNKPRHNTHTPQQAMQRDTSALGSVGAKGARERERAVDCNTLLVRGKPRCARRRK